MIGQLTVQAAKVAGFGRVFAVDIDDAKLERAKSLGADEVFNSKNCDVAAEIAARTDGHGADAALEAVGATDPIKTAISCVRKGGTVTLIGNISPKIELNLQAIVTRQIRLQGSCASSGEYPACIDLLSRGAIRVDSMISAKSPLDEAASWFDRLYKHEPNLMKVIVQP
jgi:L-iditol 2-dehydrogenase